MASISWFDKDLEINFTVEIHDAIGAKRDIEVNSNWVNLNEELCSNVVGVFGAQAAVP